jgi:SagB-type dehydrogenase family enzyme
VSDLPAGVYQYRSNNHELSGIVSGDKRSELSNAALSPRPVRTAAVIIAASAVYDRTTGKNGERRIRYVPMEAGHAAQNITLQAVALIPGSIVIGTFHDNEVKKVAKMVDREKPLYIIPVGRK